MVTTKARALVISRGWSEQVGEGKWASRVLEMI